MDKIRLPIKLLIFAVKDATLVVCFKDNESRCIKRDISAFLCYLFRLQTICRQNKIVKAATNICNSFYSDPGGNINIVFDGITRDLWTQIKAAINILIISDL